MSVLKAIVWLLPVTTSNLYKLGVEKVLGFVSSILYILWFVICCSHIDVGHEASVAFVRVVVICTGCRWSFIRSRLGALGIAIQPSDHWGRTRALSHPSGGSTGTSNVKTNLTNLPLSLGREWEIVGVYHHAMVQRHGSPKWHQGTDAHTPIHWMLTVKNSYSCRCGLTVRWPYLHLWKACSRCLWRRRAWNRHGKRL